MSRATELADKLSQMDDNWSSIRDEGAAELRRLDRVNAELVDALRHTKKCLEIANERGVLLDTLWAGDCETLFDYIDAALTSSTGQQS